MVESERFYLRRFVKEDAIMMYENWASDPEVTKYLTWNPHQNLDETIAYLDFVINTKQTNFAIVDKKTKEVIGSIANVKENVDYSFCEVGYCLSKKYWNQGVMTEVLTAYLEYLFEQNNYRIVAASHKFDNPVSGKVMIKSGFKLNYISDENIDKFGTISIHHYSITKAEFLMKKIQKNFNAFFNTNVPIFNDILSLVGHLQQNGYLVYPISLIDSSKIIAPSNNTIFNLTSKDHNIINYYFITKYHLKNQLDLYIEQFYAKNKKYIISLTNKSVEQVLVNMLRKRHFTISFAESCTGGLMASNIINISGASNVIKESYVTYSEEAKMRILNVKKETLNEYSVYSKQTAYEMAKGLQNITNANVCVSVTGLAGGNIPTTNDGTYNACIIIKHKDQEDVIAFKKTEKGLRNDVRIKQVNYIFYQIIKSLEQYN